MRIKFIVNIIIMFISLQIFSQENSFQSIVIDSKLKQNANAVVRKNNTEIIIEDYNKMYVKHYRVITVLNKAGNKNLNTFVSYDKTINIKKLEAKVYNQLGEQIDKFKKNDFKDVSAVSSISLYEDDRIKYLNYIPKKYPYTVEYIEELEYSTTAFIPMWFPIEGFNVSIQESSFSIINNTNIPLAKKVSNFEDFNIEKLGDNIYTANNIKALKKEILAPSAKNYLPYIKLALSEFDMKGVKGYNTNWKDFGKWMNDELVSRTQTLPKSTKDEILELTKNAGTNIEKAKIVYNYVQNKTRYISVQVGIGGWKPMEASDVDKLGYGDCKGLTNYTNALLKHIGVEAYYTVIYGGLEIGDIDKDFSSIQGNHVILCVPNKENYIWLECTSQTNPFGYTANFTDDRDALVLKPDGGEIIHTNIYKTSDNQLNTKANITLSNKGDVFGKVEITALGTQYGNREWIFNKTLKEKKLHYKKQWSYLNRLSLFDIDVVNDKEAIVFKEKINFEIKKYALQTGNLLLLSPNFFNRIEKFPKKYKDRKFPLSIDRGYTHKDEYIINLPESITIEALQEDVSINNKFGSYSIRIKPIQANKLVLNRKFVLNKGLYKSEDYEAYREFLLQIKKHDKAKIALKLIN